VEVGLVDRVDKFSVSVVDLLGQVGHWFSDAPDGFLCLDVFASKSISLNGLANPHPYLQ
jgi:hypothetical protein